MKMKMGLAKWSALFFVICICTDGWMFAEG